MDKLVNLNISILFSFCVLFCGKLWIMCIVCISLCMTIYVIVYVK